MIGFDDSGDADISGRCVRPLCFAAPGNEHYGLTMFEIDDILNMEERNKKYERNLMLGLQGSSTLICYRDGYFALFARHQIAKIPNESLTELQVRLEHIFVLMDDGRDSTNLPIRDFVFSFDEDNGADEDDFVAAVIEASMMTDFMRAQFFPVGRMHRGRPGDHAIGAGFPSNLQQVLMQKNGLRLQLACTSGVVTHRSARSTAIARCENDATSMDGYSGGPVFLVRSNQNTQKRFVTFLDGIVQRAGNGYLRHLAIERILDKIDEHVFQS
jgi:hypothetical protein